MKMGFYKTLEIEYTLDDFSEINLEDKTIISWEVGVNKYEK